MQAALDKATKAKVTVKAIVKAGAPVAKVATKAVATSAPVAKAVAAPITPVVSSAGYQKALASILGK